MGFSAKKYIYNIKSLFIEIFRSKLVGDGAGGWVGANPDLAWVERDGVARFVEEAKFRFHIIALPSAFDDAAILENMCNT